MGVIVPRQVVVKSSYAENTKKDQGVCNRNSIFITETERLTIGNK